MKSNLHYFATALACLFLTASSLQCPDELPLPGPGPLPPQPQPQPKPKPSNPPAPPKDTGEALIEAVFDSDDEAEVQTLLNQIKAKQDLADYLKTDAIGKWLAIGAFEKGHFKVAKLLIEAGADANALVPIERYYQGVLPQCPQPVGVSHSIPCKSDVRDPPHCRPGCKVGDPQPSILGNLLMNRYMGTQTPAERFEIANLLIGHGADPLRFIEDSSLNFGMKDLFHILLLKTPKDEQSLITQPAHTLFKRYCLDASPAPSCEAWVNLLLNHRPEQYVGTCEEVNKNQKAQKEIQRVRLLFGVVEEVKTKALQNAVMANLLEHLENVSGSAAACYYTQIYLPTTCSMLEKGADKSVKAQYGQTKSVDKILADINKFKDSDWFKMPAKIEVRPYGAGFRCDPLPTF